MLRIAKLYGFSGDLTNGLESVSVEKISFHEDSTVLRFILSGASSIGEDNAFASFISAVRKETSCDIRYYFTDVTKDNIAHVMRALTQTINTRIDRDKTDISFADRCSYDVSDGKLIINIEGNYSALISDRERNIIASSAKDFAETVLGYTFTDHVFREELTEDIAPSYDYDYPPEDYPCEPQIPEEVIELQRQQEAIEKEKKEKKKAEEEQVDKNSWEYKAKEQQKAMRENGEDKSSFKRAANAEAIAGRVQKGVSTINIADVNMNEKLINVVGKVTLTDELKLSKSGRTVIANFNIIDKTGGITAFMFLKPSEADGFQDKFAKGGYAGFQGEPTFNKGELGLKVTGIFDSPKPSGRRDNAVMKRVELHVHSKMSERDAVSDPSAIMKLAASFGHKACAITDHGVVQAFPEVYNTAKKLTVGDTDEKFKAILGCEGYLVDDGPTVVYNLPFDTSKTRHIGSVVAIEITTSGKDSCRDLIVSVAASKYRLKGYKGIPKEEEGESDAQAGEFSAKDIDKSLWNEEEIPENLRDHNITIVPFAVEQNVSHMLNIDGDVNGSYTDDGEEVIPSELVFEHVADFYAEVEDKIYGGTGEPCDSYFRMGELLDFIGDAYICGENIFDTLAFLRRAGYGINIEEHVYYRNKFLMPAICTEDVIRYGFPEHKGKTVSDTVDAIGAEVRHSDKELLNRCYKDIALVTSYLVNSKTVDPILLNEKAGHLTLEDVRSKKTKTYHIILLVRNNLGLYNMYRLVSEGLTNYFSFRPRMPKSLIKYFSSSVIIGGACERGEIYREVLSVYKACGKNRQETEKALFESETVKDILSLYDYVEIQPLCNNMFMTRQDPMKSDTGNVALNKDDIRIVNELLVTLADHFEMPCIATTDSHFLEKEDGMYRKTLLEFMGFSDADMQSDLYFRTTDEMLDEFSYLGEDKAFEVVVENTNKIADLIEYGIKPFPDGTYPPIIRRSPTDVRDIAFTKANRLYRHNGVLNEVVKARLEKELTSIIGNGFSVMYYIAYRLVKKSNNDGYIVGSRGSVGSSFVATMCGISEVNPLPPHYRCPKCCYTEFNNTGEFGSGFDMPKKNCPECGEEMIRDGQDIPFETFLGFFGDKQPDIDLNFSDEYQPRAHKYVEFLFGTSFTFRAGTIGAFQEKNAYGIIRKVGEQKGVNYTTGMMAYMSEGIIGVKNTTGQHPGGIVVIPKEMDVYEFTPVQFPANDAKKGIVTTHFDFRAMHDTILKLDILGHADPTVLRMLHEITDVDIQSIPIPDDKVMSLFVTTDALGFPLSETEAETATIGLPELGTNFARGMILEAKPTHFFDLVQLMGLSHGTDVWLGNAQDLIRNGTCDIGSVIGCRDSIMTRLIYWGVPNKDAFDIMENVRKGKVAKGDVPEKWEKWKATMKEHGVPDWYIGSCEKIKYMFPKAHAAAYSISSLRVAWFKVYYPEAYYCAFYTVRGDEFDAETMCQGVEKVTARRKLIIELLKTEDNSSRQKKLKDEYYLCEIVEEMYKRNIEFVPIDINNSEAVRFKIVEKGKIIPPLDTIDSISSAMAESVVAARKEAPFTTREDLMQRSGIGKSAMQKLSDYGLLGDMPETAQIDIFSLLGG